MDYYRSHLEEYNKDFAFQLTIAEAACTKAIDSIGQKSNRSQIVTGSQRHRDPRLPPWAFTEHGALMATNVLRSETAIHMSIFVIRAFVRLREQGTANAIILKRLAEIACSLRLPRRQSAASAFSARFLPFRLLRQAASHRLHVRAERHVSSEFEITICDFKKTMEIREMN